MTGSQGGIAAIMEAVDDEATRDLSLP